MENHPVTEIRSPVEPDSVDASLDVWGRELPDLDLGIEGIIERIDKLKHYVDRTMQETLEAYDLSHGEWKLLANLRWVGPPYRGKPGKLAKVVEMLEGDAGATIADIMMATDWQQHTVRGALAGSITKKLGRTLSSDKVEGRGRVYRIAKDSI